MSNVCHMLLVVLYFQGHCFIYMHHCYCFMLTAGSGVLASILICDESGSMFVQCTAVNIAVLPYLKEMLRHSLNNV